MTMRITTWRTMAAALLIASCRGPVASQPKPPALEGTAWKLSAIPRIDLVGEVSSTITFDAGGAMGGSDGCNRYRFIPGPSLRSAPRDPRMGVQIGSARLPMDKNRL